MEKRTLSGRIVYGAETMMRIAAESSSSSMTHSLMFHLRSGVGEPGKFYWLGFSSTSFEAVVGDRDTSVMEFCMRLVDCAVVYSVVLLLLLCHAVGKHPAISC
ncbi:hypothetical protein FOXG_19224 [Fusarium oxysporum f. sp. lycopersici 4287]|jgi:hypothetical protein|uniref:Uncharacterized protein n=3 Tax=Fusarium oxysporum TaxID=5507 RepID=W9IMW5_FUSOX|nr:hypothetical protein FOXG_19224 [Fusarium oxysporum f. sp. lycopersici 4287]EWY95967.1 hypothetical protein FOYG_04836 [Fusarium oxysporum NRRL 32931]EXK35359.1 hypothetical protein FOMG_10520 [Fusarium oxysporum f. sp. melonis 26406]KAJ0136814.1 hypothetical protein HZ326_20195 [Fusarium oxysporum f. sp. albedinis]KNB04081.1 hypothetical protein FOXG_19224 [Fusarium oxysporum f. sp. lycopersici 4287]